MIEESKAELTRKRAELVEILAPSKPLTPEDRVRFQGDLEELDASAGRALAHSIFFAHGAFAPCE